MRRLMMKRKRIFSSQQDPINRLITRTRFTIADLDKKEALMNIKDLVNDAIHSKDAYFQIYIDRFVPGIDWEQASNLDLDFLVNELSSNRAAVLPELTEAGKKAQEEKLLALYTESYMQLIKNIPLKSIVEHLDDYDPTEEPTYYMVAGVIDGLVLDEPVPLSALFVLCSDTTSTTMNHEDLCGYLSKSNTIRYKKDATYMEHISIITPDNDKYEKIFEQFLLTVEQSVEGMVRAIQNTYSVIGIQNEYLEITERVRTSTI